MADKIYSTVDKYIIHAACSSTLHIGSSVGDKSEVLVHPVSGLPFIQASSIAGVFRTISGNVNGSEITEKLFGSKAGSGDIKISDGIFRSETVKMEYRPRVKIDPCSGSVSSSTIKGSGSESGHKFEMESIAEGAEFLFTIYLYGCSNSEALKKVISALTSGDVQLGGQKSNGSGFIGVKSVFYRHFDMTAEADRALWADEEHINNSKYDNITGQLKNTFTKTQAYKLYVYGKTENDMLVKSISVGSYDDEAPKADNIRNAKGEYIVPGSSLKGVLRSRMEYIAKRLGKESIIDNAFGIAADSGTTGSRGNIIVKDTVVGKVDENDSANLEYRIHIDKFTGGVINGALFSSKNIHGDFKLEIDVADRYSPASTVGILILALRDLASGIINIGSGYNVGKGFINVGKIEIENIKQGAKAIIEGNKISDPGKVIDKCLSAVKEV